MTNGVNIPGHDLFCLGFLRVFLSTIAMGGTALVHLNVMMFIVWGPRDPWSSQFCCQTCQNLPNSLIQTTVQCLLFLGRLFSSYFNNSNNYNLPLGRTTLHTKCGNYPDFTMDQKRLIFHEITFKSKI